MHVGIQHHEDHKMRKNHFDKQNRPQFTWSKLFRRKRFSSFVLDIQMQKYLEIVLSKLGNLEPEIHLNMQD